MQSLYSFFKLPLHSLYSSFAIPLQFFCSSYPASLPFLCPVFQFFHNPCNNPCTVLSQSSSTAFTVLSQFFHTACTVLSQPFHNAFTLLLPFFHKACTIPFIIPLQFLCTFFQLFCSSLQVPFQSLSSIFPVSFQLFLFTERKK